MRAPEFRSITIPGVHRSRRVLLRALACSAALGALAVRAAVPQPSAAEILARAKASTGGAAWDALRSQHTKVSIVAGGREATAERWASILTGRSRMRVEVNGMVAFTGFDGFAPWSQEGGRQPSIDADPMTLRLAINAAYRDRLAFWYPQRHGAAIEYAGRESADGGAFDVIAITPEGGMRYELWVSAATHRIERLREPEYAGMRTEMFGDFREVQGITVPFTVRVARDDPKFDERYTVDLLEYNVPLDGIEFSPVTAGRR